MWEGGVARTRARGSPNPAGTTLRVKLLKKKWRSEEKGRGRPGAFISGMLSKSRIWDFLSIKLRKGRRRWEQNRGTVTPTRHTPRRKRHHEISPQPNHIPVNYRATEGGARGTPGWGKATNHVPEMVRRKRAATQNSRRRISGSRI